MWTYLLIIFLLAIFIIKFDINKNKGSDLFFYLLMLLLFVLVSGLRYKIGSDTLSYMDEYQYYPSLHQLRNYDFKSSRYDILWVVFCAFCKSFSDSYFFMQFFHALIINSIYFYFFYKNTKYKFTAIFLYFILGYLYFNTEILRESMAVAIFILALNSFYKRKWITYYLLISMAALFHSSALISFIFPLFFKVKFNRYFVYSLLVLTVLSGIIWQLFNEYIKYFFIFSSIESKAISYLSSEIYSYNLNGMIYGIISFVLIPLICVLYYSYHVKISPKETPFVWLYISLGLFVIFNNTIFSRFQNYLFFPFIIFLTSIFNLDMLGNKRKTIQFIQHLILIVALLVTHYYNYFKLDITETTYIYQRYVPYHSIITKQTTKEREVLDYYW